MSTSYKVLVDARVVRELRRIPAAQAARLIDAIDTLAEDPRPRGAKKLIQQPGWRLRIGVYRILYGVDDAEKTVTVYRAGHRREVYR